MKKYLLLIPFLFPLTSFAYSTISFTPNTSTLAEIQDEFFTSVTRNFSWDGVNTDEIIIWHENGIGYTSSFREDSNPDNPFVGNPCDSGICDLGQYKAVVVDYTTATECNSGSRSYSECINDFSSEVVADLGTIFTVTEGTPTVSATAEVSDVFNPLILSTGEIVLYGILTILGIALILIGVSFGFKLFMKKMMGYMGKTKF